MNLNSFWYLFLEVLLTEQYQNEFIKIETEQPNTGSQQYFHSNIIITIITKKKNSFSEQEYWLVPLGLHVTYVAFNLYYEIEKINTNGIRIHFIAGTEIKIIKYMSERQI